VRGKNSGEEEIKRQDMSDEAFMAKSTRLYTLKNGG
jgi:hypothetical protein